MFLSGGGTAAMYTVQIESLQTYQKQLTTILGDLQSGQQNKLSGTAVGTSVFGEFPEAVDFSTAYDSVRQALIVSFGEITKLVEAMIHALGASAGNYQAVEEQIAAKFSEINSQYGGAPVTVTTSAGLSTGPSSSAVGAAGTGPSYSMSRNPTGSVASPTGNASAGALG